MSYPDITELSNAWTLCICPESGCSRACTVCSSVTWAKGPCVKLRWAEHAASDAGKAAAQRFNATLRDPRVVWQGGKEPAPPSDAEIVERIIDFAEALGMYLEPWQAAALRAILLHGGDVAIGVRY